MTSIEWLIEQIESFGIDTKFINNGIEQAKEMHKQEIKKSYEDGKNLIQYKDEWGEKYYQETFVSKGSDDHISDVSKMVEVPKQEITDGEIQSTAETFWTEPSESDMKRGWKLGAKWYREQLKSRQ